MFAAETLPRWDMSVVFPSPTSPEYERAVQELLDAIQGLEALFDRLEIDKGNVAADAPVRLDQVLPPFNDLLDQARTVRSYIYAFVSTDTRDPVAQARSSELEPLGARLRGLNTRLVGWTGSQDSSRLIAESTTGNAHQYAVEKAVTSASRMLSPEEETLATELAITGSNAWVKLHGKVSSQVNVPLERGHDADVLPMSEVRALAYDPDRETRRHAYEAELAAWKVVEVPLAASMNSIKGEVILLAQKRGWASPLDEALFGANIDQETLDAMMVAANESFPDFRRYLKAKARAIGVSTLAWYDIFAPVGEGGESTWTYDRATDFVVDQFATYSQKLSDYAARNFAENWIDVPPAPGKVDGAYCMGLRNDESRILLNFKPAFGSVSTLAHELGHGYHNLCLANRTAVQSTTPMTLAETASIFCETIVRQAVLTGNFSESEKLSVLEASLQGSCQVVVDITSRFLFESSVFDLRKSRELSPSELCNAMEDAQRQTYGEGLDQELLHPFMWAAKPHYYSARSFYNFPYMFGLLFGLGLYNYYERHPEGFHARYDELLSSTGLADAAALGRGFGIDIRDVAFWRGSLDQIRSDIDRFEALIG